MPTSAVLESLAEPVVLAPMAGGPTTVALAAAVARGGGLPFLAAGYRTPAAVAEELAALRARTAAPFGLNVFVPGPPTTDADAVARYAARLDGAGAPRHDDDGWEAKLELLRQARPAVASFAFGLPAPAVLAALREVGIEPWVTVTTAAEALAAAAAGAVALVVQGVEAGGHRASFDDAAPGEVGLLALLALVRAATDLPLVAAGAVATGEGVAAVLAAGARAAQLGTAFLRTAEAGTSAPHRAALAGDAPTALTRAFTGRTARGIANRFLREHPDAPSAYPEIHHVTAPLRAAARAAGDGEVINLWAGEAYPLAADGSAEDLVRALGAGARAALADAAARVGA